MKINSSTLDTNKKWDLVIKPSKGWIDLNFKELLKYTNLNFLFAKRDFVIFISKLFWVLYGI